MGDKQQSATFPAPPPFYKHFTDANLHQLQRQHKTLASSIDQQSPAQSVDSQLPPHLRYLIPPQPPADGKWRTFGYAHDLNAPDPTLEDAGVPQLYPDHPSVKLAPQGYLIALARSLLTTFLSTCGVLAQNPGLYEQKVKDLRDMVFNMHDLINQYRPHQARESLIFMMEEHVGQLRQDIRTIEELKIKVQKSLEGINHAGDALQVGTSGDIQPKVVDANNEDLRYDQQKSTWKALEELNEEDSKLADVEAD